jgi:hypothetical protein
MDGEVQRLQENLIEMAEFLDEAMEVLKECLEMEEQDADEYFDM